MTPQMTPKKLQEIKAKYVKLYPSYYPTPEAHIIGHDVYGLITALKAAWAELAEARDEYEDLKVERDMLGDSLTGHCPGSPALWDYTPTWAREND